MRDRRFPRYPMGCNLAIGDLIFGRPRRLGEPLRAAPDVQEPWDGRVRLGDVVQRRTACGVMRCIAKHLDLNTDTLTLVPMGAPVAMQWQNRATREDAL